MSKLVPLDPTCWEGGEKRLRARCFSVGARGGGNAISGLGVDVGQAGSGSVGARGGDDGVAWLAGAVGARCGRGEKEKNRPWEKRDGRQGLHVSEVETDILGNTKLQWYVDPTVFSV